MNELTCSLGPLELRARRREMEALAHRALIEVERRPDRALIRYRADAGVGEALAHLVRRERACCPFLDLRVVTQPGAVVVEVSAPPEAQAALDGMLESLSCST